MKPIFSLPQLTLVAAKTVLIILLMNSEASSQTVFQWNGTTNTDWTTASNWEGGALPTLGSSAGNRRLNVYNASGQQLTYNSALTTTFGNNTANGRGLVIGNNVSGSPRTGFLEITGGGTISTVGSQSSDVIGNTSSLSGNSTLFLNGGNYTSGNPGLIVAFGTDTARLTIGSGVATITTLQLGNATGGGGNATVNLNGGTLAVNTITNGNNATTKTINLNGGTLQARQNDASFLSAATGLTVNVLGGGANIDTQVNNITIGANLVAGSSGTGGLNKSGTGELTLSGTNTYVGNTTVSAGTLTLSGNGTMGTGGLVVNGGTANFNGLTRSITSLSGTGGTVNLGTSGTSTLTVGDSTNTSYSGSITGGATNGLVKVGSGNLTLSGVNSFAGGARVDAGTLTFNSSAVQTFTGGVTVNGGTLVLDNANLSTPTNLMNAANSLTLGGGQLTVKGRTVASNTVQSVASTTLNMGASTVRVEVPTGGTSTTLNLGQITRNAGSILLVSADTTNGQTSSSRIVTTSGITYNGTSIAVPATGTRFVGAGIFVGTGTGTRHAQINASGQVVTPPFATAMVASGGDTSTVYNLNAGGALATLTGDANTYAMIYNQDTSTSPSNNQSLGGSKLTTNGLLNINTANVNISGTNANAGIVIGTERELVINTGSTGNITINTAIADNAAGSSGLTYLAQSTGVLTLTGANTYTGTTNITRGVLQLGNAGTAGSLATSGTINIASGATFRINQTDTVIQGTDFSTAGIAGAGGLTQAGTGTTALTAANTYTGATSVTAGTLQLGNGGTTGSLATSSAIAVSSGATFSVNRSNTVTQGTDFSGAAISGSGGFTQAGTGTTVLSAANTYTGTTNVLAGTLRLQSTTSSGAFNVSSAAVLDLNIVGTVGNTTNATFSGTGTLLKTGTGTVNWGTGIATFAMGSGSLIDVQAGTFTGGSNNNEVWTNNRSDLRVASGALFNGVEANVRVNKIEGSGTISTGFNIPQYANFTIGVDDGSSTFNGVIQNGSSAGNLVKAGTGTISLAGTNTYTGTTTISGGSLQIGSGGTTGSLATASTISVGSGATFGVNRSNAVTQGTDFSGAAISGAGGFVQVGAGETTLNQANTYSGGTTVSNGTLTLVGNGTLGTGGLTVNGGTANFNGLTRSLASLSGSGGTVNLGTSGTSTLTVGDASNTTYSGVIAGGSTNELTKVGTGTLTLSGTNTYTGATNITAGTLAVNGSTHAASVVNIGTAGTLTGSGVINGNATLTGGGVINKTSGSIAGTLDVTGGNWNGAGTVGGLVTASSGTFNIGSGATLTTASGLNVTGTGVLSGAANSTIAGSVNYTSSASSSYAGSIIGGNTLTLDAAGTTLTLTGANSYTGTTTVHAGTLVVNGSTGSGDMTIGSGATLAGSGTIRGDLVVLNGGSLNPGNSPGTLNFSGNLTNSGTINMELAGLTPGSYDVLNGNGGVFNFGGILALTNNYSYGLGDTLTLFTNWGSFVGSFSAITGTDLGNGLQWNTSRLGIDGSIRVTAVPEPTSLAFGLIGVAAGLVMQRKRQRNSLRRKATQALAVGHE